jgi:hypothetical protein
VDPDILLPVLPKFIKFIQHQLAPVFCKLHIVTGNSPTVGMFAISEEAVNTYPVPDPAVALKPDNLFCKGGPL